MKDKKESKGIGWNLDNSYLNLPKVFFSKINLNPVSSPQLIILNDNIGIVFLHYPILCYVDYIFFFINENDLRICYNIKKNDLNISLIWSLY